MLAESHLRLLPRRLAALAPLRARHRIVPALLLAATLDGQLRHALGLVHDGPEGAVWIHGWCRRIVRCLGVRYTVNGDLPGRLAASREGYEAIVCNHLSYIDILLLSATRPFVMVAKNKVRGWPLLGWLTAQAGTVSCYPRRQARKPILP